MKPFVKAEEIRSQKRDYEMWVQGGYFYDGISAALANFGAGLSGKNGKGKYTEQPYHTKTSEQDNAEEQRTKAVEWLNRLAMRK